MTKKTVVPALPGFDVVELDHDEKTFSYFPIVAWVVCDDSTDDDDGSYGFYASPICTEYECQLHNSTLPIRHPDGSIIFPGTTLFKKGEESNAIIHAIQQSELREARIKEAATQKINAKMKERK